MAIITLFLTEHARITVSPKTKVFSSSVQWLGDATIRLQDSSKWSIQGAVFGSDSSSRFFILGSHAALERKIDSLIPYSYPIGYGQGVSSYRGFTIDMKSLGQSGSRFVSVELRSNVSGSINYEKYFPSNDPSCLAGSWISFNCIGQDGWHCDGPSDYEYIVYASAPDYCGGSMRRIIKTSTGSNSWQDSIESVMGSLGQNFCQYSNWSGGRYKDFSDFALASSASVLPVVLVDVRADPINNLFIRVSWETQMEINNDKFFVGRSADGNTFTIIGEVLGYGSTTVPQNYLFDDRTAVLGVQYYYQLEQVDYDGATHLSPIVAAKLEEGRVLSTKNFNILGQIVSPDAKGLIIRQITTSNGMRIFKTVVE